MRAEYAEVVCAAFGYGANVGNETVVVFGADDLCDDMLRSIASGYGIVAAIVLPAPGLGAHYRLRFFAPTGELAMCVHGLIGAVTALINRDPRLPQSLRIDTVGGPVPVSWRASGGRVEVTVAQDPPKFGRPLRDHATIARVLGLSEARIDERFPIRLALSSRPKLLVAVRTAATLDRVRPRFESMWRLCERQSASGIYVFTTSPRSRDRDIDARHFPVRAGFLEDPATGNAAAALAAYLVNHHEATGIAKHHFVIGQGDAMGKRCRLFTEVVVHGGAVVGTWVRGEGRVLGVQHDRLRSRTI